jgi:hypothetical protein
MRHRFATILFLELAVPNHKIANRNGCCRHLTAVAREHLLQRRRVGEATACKRLRIPPTSRLRLLARLPNFCLILFTKHDIQRASLLYHTVDRNGIRIREEVLSLRQNPRETKAGWEYSYASSQYPQCGGRISSFWRSSQQRISACSDANRLHRSPRGCGFESDENKFGEIQQVHVVILAC